MPDRSSGQAASCEFRVAENLSPAVNPEHHSPVSNLAAVVAAVAASWDDNTAEEIEIEAGAANPSVRSRALRPPVTQARAALAGH